jgi:hypothetical protein
MGSNYWKFRRFSLWAATIPKEPGALAEAATLARDWFAERLR